MGVSYTFLECFCIVICPNIYCTYCNDGCICQTCLLRNLSINTNINTDCIADCTFKPKIIEYWSKMTESSLYKLPCCTCDPRGLLLSPVVSLSDDGVPFSQRWPCHWVLNAQAHIIVHCSLMALPLMELYHYKMATKGITGLWWPGTHWNITIWCFSIGSSYHSKAEFIKRWIVHLLKWNVSWA